MDNPQFRQLLETASRALDHAFERVRSQQDWEAFKALLDQRGYQYRALWVGRVRRQAADGDRYLTPEKLWSQELLEAEVYFDPNAARQDALRYEADVEECASLLGQ